MTGLNFFCRHGDRREWSLNSLNFLFSERCAQAMPETAKGEVTLLLQGIRAKLFTLPAETVVYPGHGPVTTVGHEMKTNPYLA